MGDFNLPGINWDRWWSASAGERMVLDTLGDMFWHQLVRGPTHRLGNTLDLCLTSWCQNRSPKVSRTILSPALADHHLSKLIPGKLKSP